MPILGALNQASTQGITFDIPEQLKQVCIVLNGNRFEPALIDWPCSSGSVEAVPPERMRYRKAPHELAHLLDRCWPQNEVPMVRHDAVAQKPHRHFLGQLEQELFKRSVISRVAEKR